MRRPEMIEPPRHVLLSPAPGDGLELKQPVYAGACTPVMRQGLIFPRLSGGEVKPQSWLVRSRGDFDNPVPTPSGPPTCCVGMA
jgi:hypothetical protein